MIKFCKKCQAETERKVNGACKPCTKKTDAAYRAVTHEKRKVTTAAWYAKNHERKKVTGAAWAAANPERHRANRTAWKAANPEKSKAYTAAWQAANTDRLMATGAAWAKANPEAKRIHAQNRRARKRETGGSLSNGLSAMLFNLQKGKCACCSLPLGTDFHLDHIMPLALGGTNTDDNIQLLRPRCNHQKKAKHPIDFMQQRGFLL